MSWLAGLAEGLTAAAIVVAAVGLAAVLGVVAGVTRYDGPLVAPKPVPGRHRRPRPAWQTMAVVLLVAAAVSLLAGFLLGWLAGL